VLGSVTEKVLRITQRPVLTVPPPVGSPLPGPPLYKTILCPLDFSDASTRALEYALSLAEEADARLILLHVVEGFIEPGQLGENVHFTVPEYRRYLEQDAMSRLRAAVPEEARLWCKPEERLASGKAYREILRVALESNVELIVMGVHGRNAMTAWLFGSTTQHVVRHATCPVLTLRG
jgi:nucleotide-binding universal stress UspA family protein